VGYELQAFIGEAGELRGWKRELPATVVCRLSGELWLVPVTGWFEKELLAHTGAPHLIEAVHAWAAAVSRRTLIAHVSGFEFGDRGTDDYLVWAGGEIVLATPHEGKVAAIFRERAGLDAGAGFDIGRHRGESAADKWAAEARLEDQVEAARR
jgi:hypothetical protein